MTTEEQTDNIAASLYTVVVGCGRLGSLLANRLSRRGHSVVVVDVNRSSFGKLSPEYSGFHVEGDATELAVLEEAKVSKADLVIATTREDNVNLMVAQIAGKVYSVPRVIARVFTPAYEESYRRMGVEVICPTREAARLFLEAVDHEEAVAE
ncbi:MAG: TrkA family potassium uptake protein [Planctomycetota bacterium]